MTKKKDVPASKAAAAVVWNGVQMQRVKFDAGTTVFAQGDVADTVMYVEEGTVLLSVLSHG